MSRYSGRAFSERLEALRILVFDPETLGWYGILKVNLVYFPKFHERCDDYPMAPELTNLTPELLSDTQHDVVLKYFNAAALGRK